MVMVSKLVDLVVDECSFVDRPANTGARILMVKRANPARTMTAATRERLLASRTRMLKALEALPAPLLIPPTKGLHTTGSVPANQSAPKPAKTLPTLAELVMIEIDLAVKALRATPRGAGLSYEAAVAQVLKDDKSLYDKYLQAQAETTPVLTAKMSVDRLQKSVDYVATAMLAGKIMRETPGLTFEHAMELASYQTRYGI